MIVRDGRNVVHDLGPQRTFAPSMLRPIGVGPADESKTGPWTGASHKHLFAPKPTELSPFRTKGPRVTSPKPTTLRTETKTKTDKKAYDRQYAANRRANRTPEQREAARKYHREYKRRRNANAT